MMSERNDDSDMAPRRTLAGRVALVTGAGGGIGAEISRYLARSGASVALHCNRSLQRTTELCETLGEGGHRVFCRDLSDPSQGARLVADVIDQMGAVDILVNNAGIYEEFPCATGSVEGWLDNWQRTLAVNLLAPACLSYAAASHMVARGGGKIINISSRGAFRGEPQAPSYGASKAGLNALGQSLAKGLGDRGVLVYTIAPGFVETDLVSGLLEEAGEALRAESPLGRVATPADVAATVVFLAGPDSEFLTGTIVDVNGASYLRS